MNESSASEIQLFDDSDNEDGSEEIYNELFGEVSDSEEEFLGFSSDDSDETDQLDSTQPAKKQKLETLPPSWDMKKWTKGDKTLQDLPTFTAIPGIKKAIPDDADELFFLKLFLSDEIISELTAETNLYAAQFFEKNEDKLKKGSNFHSWPRDGIGVDKMTAFLALTYYFGILEKDNLKSYWSTNPVYLTPFPRTVMSRTEFSNILSFLHCTDNNNYPVKGQPGYNPKNKLGNILPAIQRHFSESYVPAQHISIDEGTIAFKGNVSFKVYNPNKPDKYGIKTYKLCDSTNGYCCTFDLYVGKVDGEEQASGYGKTYDLVYKLLKEYLGKGYIVYMDNFYTSAYLFYTLRKNNIAACGTTRPRKGIPDEITKAKLKSRGESVTMTYSNEMVAIRIYDRKPVTLLSTAYNCDLVDTGKKHWKTKEPVHRPKIIQMYNQYMGGVDLNDQLLNYSAFRRQSVKWWKKVLFRLLNLAMVNAYILFKVHSNKPRRQIISQTNFRLNVVKLLIEECGESLNPPCLRRTSSHSLEIVRLTARHFPEKIPSTGQKNRISRSCRVCVPAERQIDSQSGTKKKRPGRETSYQCSLCNVALCVDPCFSLYHSYKDYESKYISMKKAAASNE